MGMGTGFAKTRGYTTRVWVCLQTQLRNLATAVHVSIDTAVHIARLDFQLGGGWDIANVHHFPRLWAACRLVCWWAAPTHTGC